MRFKTHNLTREHHMEHIYLSLRLMGGYPYAAFHYIKIHKGEVHHSFPYRANLNYIHVWRDLKRSLH